MHTGRCSQTILPPGYGRLWCSGPVPSSCGCSAGTAPVCPGYPILVDLVPRVDVDLFPGIAALDMPTCWLCLVSCLHHLDLPALLFTLTYLYCAAFTCAGSILRDGRLILEVPGRLIRGMVSA